jgi:effector-binding domain-containing protein
MQIKEIKPMNFLYFETETKVSELANFVGRVPKALQLEAAKLGLVVTGPVYWNYVGFAGDVSQPFVLEISIPVDEFPANYRGEFKLKRTSNFKCLSVMHEGSWLDIPKTYGSMMQYVMSHQLQPTFNNREVYVNCDFIDPLANITEIQMGIN